MTDVALSVSGLKKTCGDFQLEDVTFISQGPSS